MNKHARLTLVLDRTQQAPKHSTGWTYESLTEDVYGRARFVTPYSPGRHAKPFGKHHIATPVTYNRTGNVTPLRPAQHTLDVAA